MTVQGEHVGRRYDFICLLISNDVSLQRTPNDVGLPWRLPNRQGLYRRVYIDYNSLLRNIDRINVMARNLIR